MRSVVLLLIVLVLAAGLSVPATGAVTSTFDADAEGWLAADLSPTVRQWEIWTSDSLSWGPHFGMQGGGVNAGDVWYWTHITAPGRYLGDWSHGYGSSITFDILINYSDYAGYPCVTLIGLHKTLYYVLPEPTVGAWSHVVVPLTEANCYVNHYLGPPATKRDVMEVLASVEGLLIMTEWCTGPDDTFVDNIVLNVDPRRPKGPGIRGASLNDPILSWNSLPYRFTTWGRAQNVTADGFQLDDGSGVPVNVEAPGHSGIANGDYASATGVVEPWRAPLTVRCDPRDIVKRN